MTRDERICKEYAQGDAIPLICQRHGVGERRLFQILKKAKVNRRIETSYEEKAPLSPLHLEIGMRVYNAYFNKGLTRLQASKAIGVSPAVLRNIELGHFDLTLFTLQSLAQFMGVEIHELFSKGT